MVEGATEQLISWWMVPQASGPNVKTQCLPCLFDRAVEQLRATPSRRIPVLLGIVVSGSKGTDSPSKVSTL